MYSHLLQEAWLNFRDTDGQPDSEHVVTNDREVDYTYPNKMRVIYDFEKVVYNSINFRFLVKSAYQNITFLFLNQNICCGCSKEPMMYVKKVNSFCHQSFLEGAQWLSGRVLDSRPKGRGFEPHRRHCVVSLSKNINPSLVLVQPRKTRPFITERLLMGRKESKQTNKQNPSLTNGLFHCIAYYISTPI